MRMAVIAAINATWNECPLYSTPNDAASVRAQCAKIDLPFCHTGVCVSDKTISVFVKRIVSSALPAKSVWVLNGGLGHAAHNDALLEKIYTGANGKVSVYTMDPRGTGQSNFVETQCSSNISSLNDTVACFGTIKNIYGVNAPKGFSLTSSAMDVVAITQSSIFSNEQVYIFGLSYGTNWVERIMHFAPTNVKGYIIDKIASEIPSDYWSIWNNDISAIEAKYYDLCDDDAFCSSKIGPNSYQYAHKLLQKLDQKDSDCSLKIAESQETPSVFVANILSSLFQYKDQRPLLPAVLHHLNRCIDDFPSEEMFLKALLKYSDNLTIKDKIEDRFGNDASIIAYSNILYSELWPTPSQSFQQIRNQTILTTWKPPSNEAINQMIAQLCVYRGHDEICNKTQYSNDFYYPHDTFWNRPAQVPNDSSVLLLASDLDVNNSTQYSNFLYSLVNSDNKLLLKFPFGERSVFKKHASDPTCAFTILLSYLGKNGDLTQIDSSCIANVPQFRFQAVLDTSTTTYLFNSTANMYIDPTTINTTTIQAILSPSNTNTSPPTFALLGCGSLLVIAIAAFLYVKSKRLHVIAVDTELPPSMLAAVQRVNLDDEEETKEEEEEDDKDLIAH
ncbi:serine protease family S33 [Thraustotheca clavata]|uniref:Serine protease family S33 n=1 Tax=Thraustotheca clavata TaxID=74557 RepID=A0A1W0A253_9STRA|nr:serine protease family S33 [Thraustotheca clavata]